MKRRLYPLNALRAFEAAGRHLSFVKAAEELHVTPGAISHQIKGLEKFLHVQLFRRQPQRVFLTDEGQSFLIELHNCFTLIDRAVDKVLENNTRGALSISAAPVFAAKWLGPRLEAFRVINPDIDLRISSSLSVIDFQRDSFDAAIRLCNGNYPGLVSIKLFDEAVTPMLSPHLITGDAQQLTPDDLRHYVLLHDDSLCFNATSPKWGDWLQAAGAGTIDDSHGPHFSHPDHALQAAIDGAGVVLGWQSLASADIEAGRLIAPFDLTLPLGMDFHLVYPEGNELIPKVAALKTWMLDTLKHPVDV